MSEDRGARRPRGRKPRRKVCAFCVEVTIYKTAINGTTTCDTLEIL